MIIDSPIISGSYAASGSLNQLGDVTITGSLTVSGPIIGDITGSATSASYAASASNAQNAATASYLSNYIPPFPFTGSAGISGSLTVNGNITAQTLIVQTITSSVDFITGSTRFGTEITNTHEFTGSVTTSGSIAVSGSIAAAVFMNPQTIGDNIVVPAGYNALVLGPVDMSASIQVGSGSNLTILENFTNLATTGSNSFVGNQVVTGSITATSGFTGSLQGTATNATSASYALTASYSANVPVTSSYANNAATSSYALTSSYSLSGGGFPYSGSALITGSLLITNLEGTGVRYLVTDPSGSITAQTASAVIKTTQAYTATPGQTIFNVTNGYSTGYVDVFVNGSKLNATEFTDTSGTNIVLATGSFADDVVEVVKYLPASGVSNNVLRQQTIFTASAGQTVFSASYTPGLIDIFYNGSKLNSGDFTANNGTFFTLATASAANDILDVFVYSYQVGAFSGIGGTGTATQVAYFDSTNSITGSPNFTISGSTMTVTGSLTVSGSGTFTNIGPAVFSGSITSTQGFTGSFSGTATNATSASYATSATSASYALNTTSASYAITASSADDLLVRGTLTAQTLVVQTITSSIDFVTGSTRFGSLLGNTHVFTGSVSMNPGGLFVSSSGLVGIGTTSPTYALDVVSSTSGNLGRFYYNDGTFNPRLQITGDSTGITFFESYSTSADSIKFSIAGSNTLTLKGDNVGVGITTPSYRLHVSGAFSSNPGLYVYGTTYGMVGVDRGSSASSAGVNYYTTGSQRWFTGIYENTNNFGFYNALSANFPMVITTGSRVGIGTTNPSHPLHVASSTVYQILAEQTSTDTSNTGAYATFYAVNNAGLSQVRGLFGAGGNSVGNTALRNAVYYGAQSDHSVVFMANDAERMRITNVGDVSMTGTGAIKIHSGTTAQRPSATTGQIRYNTSFNFLEYYDGSNWVPVVGQTSPGSSASNPAESANEIKTYNPNATNGLYWIRQVGTVPVQAYCVFTDYNGSAIQGGPWTVPFISNDANTNFSENGPTAAAQFLAKCQAIGIASPGRGMENTRTTTEVYGAWLAVKRALWNNYSTFITNGTTGGGAVLRMPMININGAGGASDQRLVYNTSLGTHLPPNIDGDACNAAQLFCGWWAGTDVSGWRVNDNAIPGPEDWNPSDTVNSSYNGNGIQSVLTICVYK